MKNNKQELINWMTEKRENLPFESKVQLIKDFWVFCQKYGKNNFKEIEQLFIEEQLKREQELENEFHRKDQQWQINFQHLQQSKDKELENKDKRILEQSEKITKAVDILKKKDKEIEEKQKNIKKLTTELENSEPKDAHVMSFLAHLQEDLKSELETKETTKERIKDLELQLGDDKLARDKELQDLRKELAGEKEKTANLTIQLENAVKIDKMVFDLLGKFSGKTTLLEKTQHIASFFDRAAGIGWILIPTNQDPDTIKNQLTEELINRVRGNSDCFLTNILAETLTLLKKELSWWDKWFADDQTSLIKGFHSPGICLLDNSNQYVKIIDTADIKNLDKYKQQNKYLDNQIKTFIKTHIYKYYLNR